MVVPTTRPTPGGVESSTAPKGSVVPIVMTKQGYANLHRELSDLSTTARDEVADRLRAARADGTDPAENGALMDALDDFDLLERRIAAIQARLAQARIAGPPANDGTAGIGMRVRLRGSGSPAVAYELVGVGEGDPDRLRVAIDSPVGQAVAGRRAGETIVVSTPRGRVLLEVVAVERLDPGLADAA
jgi:transcription elongation factor GreA